jgi:hypothetical protein
MLRMPKTIIRMLYFFVILSILPGCASPVTAQHADLTAEAQATLPMPTPEPTLDHNHCYARGCSYPFSDGQSG